MSQLQVGTGGHLVEEDQSRFRFGNTQKGAWGAGWERGEVSTFESDLIGRRSSVAHALTEYGLGSSLRDFALTFWAAPPSSLGLGRHGCGKMRAGGSGRAALAKSALK